MVRVLRQNSPTASMGLSMITRDVSLESSEILESLVFTIIFRIPSMWHIYRSTWIVDLYGKLVREIYRSSHGWYGFQKVLESATDISGDWSGATEKLEESQNPTESHRDPWTLEGFDEGLRNLKTSSVEISCFLGVIGFFSIKWGSCVGHTMFEKDSWFICTWYHMIRSIAYSTPVESEDVQWVFLTFL